MNNIIYANKANLRVIEKRQITTFDFVHYFYDNKLSPVFVIDANGVLDGYVNDASLKANKANKESINVLAFPVTLYSGNHDLFKVAEFFHTNKNVPALPVVDIDNKLVGAFIYDYPTELSSYGKVMNDIAMDELSLFDTEYSNFLRGRNIKKVFVSAKECDFEKFYNVMSKHLTVQRYSGESIKICNHNDYIILDMQHSKGYLLDFYGSKILKRVFTLQETLSCAILPVVLDYVSEQGGRLFFVEGPMKEKLKSSEERWPQLYSEITLSDALQDPKIRSKFYDGNKEMEKWALDERNGVMGGASVVSNGIHILMSDFVNDFSENETNINVFGPCLVYGSCVKKKSTITSFLSNILQEKHIPAKVINCGVKNGHSVLNDFLYILDTKIKQGDILFDINYFGELIGTEIGRLSHLYEFSDYLNKNLNGIFFLDNTFHANEVVNKRLSDFIFDILSKEINVTSVAKSNEKRTYKNFFESNGMLTAMDPKRFVDERMLQDYVNYLESIRVNGYNGEKIGSVILTANPLTKGHEYLVNYALHHCDLLYVFIVEEDRFMFSTVERVALAKMVFNDKRIRVVRTGNLMTASFTFPEYFKREATDSMHAIDIPNIHFYIFCNIVAKVLNINIRFVGNEDKDAVTNSYNKKLKDILPHYGIDVVIVNRALTSEGNAVSASDVRSYYRSGNFDKLQEYVSTPVFNYLKKRYEHDTTNN